jgi:hypothetical protein
MTMRERIKLAIEEAMRAHGDADIRAGLAWTDLDKVTATVMAAWREPTEAMLVAGRAAGGFDGLWQQDNTLGNLARHE